MADERPAPTLADYVALALSPALLMALVGSLVFFLLEVLYQGEYGARLRWILFFFVFGAVLIARISMMADVGGRATLYGLALGFLVWLGMQFFVDYPEGGLREFNWLINLALIGLVWWCAHRLTWDCTHVDDDAEPDGEGLLQAAGLEKVKHAPAPPAEAPAAEEAAKPEGWLARYRRYREERKKRRPLGVWVVYFSLAALPVFGLGQSLIPAEDGGRRRYVFWLMSVYVGSGLGLLLTTCFLGLRRYLRRRKLRMPAAMTGAWLSLGGTLVLVLLLAGAFLPRPEAEYPILDLGLAKSHKRSASKYAFKGDSPGKGDGQAGGKDTPDEQGRAGRDGKNGDGPGKDASQGGKSGSQSGKDGGPGKGEQSQGKDGSAKPGQGEQGSGQDKQKGAGKVQGAKGGRKDDRQSRGDSSSEEDGQESGEGSSSSGQTLSKVGEALRGLAPVLKWVVFAIVALVAAYFVLRNVLQFLANFTDWARRLLQAWYNFWASLFGGGGRKKEEGAEAEVRERAIPERPFSSFRNPFAGGGGGRSSAELVRYTFAAAQAWARERGLARQPGETPLEFADRVGGEVPALEADLRRLAILFARAAYARGGLPASTQQSLRQFWERLESVAEQPLSA